MKYESRTKFFDMRHVHVYLDNVRFNIFGCIFNSCKCLFWRKRKLLQLILNNKTKISFPRFLFFDQACKPTVFAFFEVTYDLSMLNSFFTLLYLFSIERGFIYVHQNNSLQYRSPPPPWFSIFWNYRNTLTRYDEKI